MPRNIGSASTINKKRKQIARSIGKPTSKIKAQTAIKKAGLRIPKLGNVRPGAQIKIQSPKVKYIDRITGEAVMKKTGPKTARTVQEALKKMKQMNPKTLRPTKRR